MFSLNYSIPTPLSLVIVVVICFVITHGSVAQQLPTPTPTSQIKLPKFKAADVKKVKLNFGVSSSAPLANVFLNDSELKQSYKHLISFVVHIDRAVQYATSRASGRRSSRNDSDSDDSNMLLLTTCNRNNDGWNADAEIFLGVRGITPADDTCISDVYGTTREERVTYPPPENNDSGEEPLKFTDAMVYDIVTSHSALVNASAKKVVIEPTWNRSTAAGAVRAHAFEYFIRTQRCTYDYAGFVYLSGLWYVVERITNADKDVVQAEGLRRYVYEFVSDQGSSNAMMFRNSSEDESEGPIWTGVTTSSANYTGAVTGSCFGDIYAADNLAVGRALQRGEHQTQQAADATTPSNIAILVFPLVMNVVPVALIADVNSIGMLLYTLLTDVLTAVPLAIKGVEVLLIGKRSNYAVVTRISGANENSTELNKVAEVWVAQCIARGSYTGTGVTLLVVALMAMVGGIIAEFWAKMYVSRRKKYKVHSGDHVSNDHSSLFIPLHTKSTSLNGQGHQMSQSPLSSPSVSINPAAPLSNASAVLARNGSSHGPGGSRARNRPGGSGNGDDGGGLNGSIDAAKTRSRSRSRSRSTSDMVSSSQPATYEFGAVGAASSLGQGHEQPPSPSAVTHRGVSGNSTSMEPILNDGSVNSRKLLPVKLTQKRRIVHIHRLGSTPPTEGTGAASPPEGGNINGSASERGPVVATPVNGTTSKGLGFGLGLGIGRGKSLINGQQANSSIGSGSNDLPPGLGIGARGTPPDAPGSGGAERNSKSERRRQSVALQ